MERVGPAAGPAVDQFPPAAHARNPGGAPPRASGGDVEATPRRSEAPPEAEAERAELDSKPKQRHKEAAAAATRAQANASLSPAADPRLRDLPIHIHYLSRSDQGDPMALYTITNHHANHQTVAGQRLASMVCGLATENQRYKLWNIEEDPVYAVLYIYFMGIVSLVDGPRF